jgi:hypothetical protein
LVVKVNKNWRSNTNMLRRFGYNHSSWNWGWRWIVCNLLFFTNHNKISTRVSLYTDFFYRSKWKPAVKKDVVPVVAERPEEVPASTLVLLSEELCNVALDWLLKFLCP